MDSDIYILGGETCNGTVLDTVDILRADGTFAVGDTMRERKALKLTIAQA